MSATSFTFEPVFLGLAAAALLAYAWAARNERPSARRIVLFVLGLLLIAASLNSPLETIAAKRLLLVHLLQNALIADIAPPLSRTHGPRERSGRRHGTSHSLQSDWR